MYDLNEIEKSLEGFALVMKKFDFLLNEMDNANSLIKGTSNEFREIKIEKENLNKIYQQLKDDIANSITQMDDSYQKLLKYQADEFSKKVDGLFTLLNKKVGEMKNNQDLIRSILMENNSAISKKIGTFSFIIILLQILSIILFLAV